MKHDKFDELIQGFIDNELTKKEEKILKKHLKSCNECRKKLGFRKKEIKLIKKSKENIKTPEDLIRSVITNTSGRNIYVINWKPVIIGAAAIIIVSLILFIYFNNLRTPMARDIEIEESPIVERFEMREEKIEKPQKEIVQKAKEEKEDSLNEVIKIPEKEFFAETRLVFPEEGSVVGNKFDVVIILKETGRKIELDIDGEKRVFESKDSNVLYINSDSLPILENGIHCLSLMAPVKEKINFFKEG
jgi:hypothetical protein